MSRAPVRRPVALALRALGLGDFVAGIPALALLRRALPDHRIVLAAPAVLAPLVALAPVIDAHHPVGELEPLTGFAHPVDLAMDLHGKGPESRRLLADLHPARLLGFADPVAGLSGPPWRADEHEVARWCRLVLDTLRPPADPMPTVAGSLLRPAGPVPAGLTLVHPGAAAPARRWPPERFAEVARTLAARGHRVAITGGPAEAELAADVARRSGTAPLLGLGLAQLAAVIADARLLVSGDTGVAHLASAYRTPSVVLFGPVSPAAWGPPDDFRHVAVFHGDGRGDPHGHRPDRALLEIQPAEILAAAEQVLSVSRAFSV